MKGDTIKRISLFFKLKNKFCNITPILVLLNYMLSNKNNKGHGDIMKFRLIESGGTASYQDLGESLTRQHLDYVIHNVLDWKRHYSPTKITPEAVARACRAYDSEFTTQEYIAAINKYNALHDYIEKDRKKRYGGSVYRSSEIIKIIKNEWGSYISEVQDSGKGYIVVEYPDGWLHDGTALDREEYMSDEFDDCRVYVNRVGPNTLHVTSKELFD